MLVLKCFIFKKNETDPNAVFHLILTAAESLHSCPLKSFQFPSKYRVFLLRESPKNKYTPSNF